MALVTLNTEVIQTVFHQATSSRNSSWSITAATSAFGEESKFGLRRCMLLLFTVPNTLDTGFYVSKAVIEMTASAVKSGVFTTDIVMVPKDTFWHLLVPPGTPFGWVDNGDGNHFDVELRTSGGSTLEDTLSTSGTASWSLQRDDTDLDAVVAAQMVTITTGGDIDVARLRLKRVGTIAGTDEIFVTIQGLDGDGLPDDSSVLATSDIVVPSGLSTSEADVDFDFGTPHTVSANDKVAVVLNVSYNTGAGGVNWHHEENLYPESRGHLSIKAVGSDIRDTHYINQKSLPFYDEPNTSLFGLGAFNSKVVKWTPPTFETDVTYTTPNLNHLVNEYISPDESYEAEDKRLLFGFSPGDSLPDEERAIYNEDHATGTPARLIMEWRSPRNVMVI